MQTAPGPTTIIKAARLVVWNTMKRGILLMAVFSVVAAGCTEQYAAPPVRVSFPDPKAGSSASPSGNNATASGAVKRENPFPPGTPYGDDPNPKETKSSLLRPQDDAPRSTSPRTLYPGATDPVPGTGYGSQPSGGSSPATGSPYGGSTPYGGSGPSSGSESPQGGNPYGGSPYGG